MGGKRVVFLQTILPCEVCHGYGRRSVPAPGSKVYRMRECGVCGGSGKRHRAQRAHYGKAGK